ncbi:hypothetical protein BDB00DRAFT_806155 [Zychaea mexicana]|uniref:uncharacterized protein n=1 Tax=Zychaea mexicana TaxID=64656 RepID=UPI0022FF39D2|nr:uncharacterized protein BDB00DRAFT_806155 [Zychaea mexicana]KAI9496952.1 hypothetical protein BDB00DRAFT_806155 [Zychaea mexicana]
MSLSYEYIPKDDPRINLETLDIFSPSDRWRSVNLAPRSTQQQQQSDSPKPIAATTANAVDKNTEPNNLYCTACKRKFSNEATFQGHLKSAKHIANEKKSKPNKKAAGNNAASGRQQQQPQDPAVKDALNKLKQALTAAKSSNPAPAIGVLWSLSKTFYTLKRPQNTFQALEQLIYTLETLQLSSDKTCGLTPSQVASTLYASRLALARLLYLYKTDASIAFARTLSLKALQGKWKIDSEQLVILAQQCGDIPLDRVMVHCRNLGIRYIEREEKREGGPPAPKLDKNQSFVAILTEAAAMFQNDDTESNNQQGECAVIADDIVTVTNHKNDQLEAPSNSVAIVLLCLTAIVSKHETGFQPHYYMEKVSEMYEKCAKIHQASQARVISHGMSADNKYVASWNLFMALLLALEIDDFVRADSIIRIIENEGLNRSYMDMQVLVSIAKACKECDYTTLKHTVPHQLEHLELLLEETNVDMILRHLTDPMKQSDTIVRLQMLAALVPK